MRIDSKTIFKKSLNTSNLTYAIILKLKILSQLGKSNMNNKGYITQLTGSTLNLIAENEEEQKLLVEIEKTVISKINRLSKDNCVNIENKEQRDTNTLKKLSKLFVEFREKTGTSNRVMMKYKQALEYLSIYFGDNKKVKDINERDSNDFQLFLLSLPKNWKGKKELKGKNLKTLYKKNSKLLDQYEKQTVSTVREVLVKVKTIFNYLLKNTYIYKNPFEESPKTIKRNITDKREFKPSELKMVFNHLKEQNLLEDYIFIKFLLYTGVRRGEGLLIKKSDVNFEKCIIDVDGTKTDNSKRITIIHKDLVDDLKQQLENKTDDDYLFYNQKLSIKYRDEKIGNNLNSIIKDVLGEELKKLLSLHSLRKNFSQDVYLSNLFDELSYKTLIGHSTNNDVTDVHYLRGKRDYKMLKKNIDKVDFSNYF